MIQLNFAQEWHYEDDDDGIPIEVSLTYAGTTIEVQAKVDPGAAVCLFTREDGMDLGIPLSKAFRSGWADLPVRLTPSATKSRCKPATSHSKASSISPNIQACNEICSVGRAGFETCGSASLITTIGSTSAPTIPKSHNKEQRRKREASLHASGVVL